MATMATQTSLPRPTSRSISAPRSISPTSGDDWRLVEDKKLRKKIQDRLAQRARRRRIAETKQKQKERSAVEHNAAQVDMQLVAAVAPANLLSPSEYHLLPRRFMSALTALFNNGIALGMHPSQSCSMAISRPNPTVPESLRPTHLQLTTIHYTSIDRFPFPVFRNNLILMQELIDPQEFLYDIINMHSFWVIDGKPSWEPSAWRMGRDYEKKWGYLFLGDGGKPPVSVAIAPAPVTMAMPPMAPPASMYSISAA